MALLFGVLEYFLITALHSAHTDVFEFGLTLLNPSRGLGLWQRQQYFTVS
jgi:hypothetical protein